MAQQAAVSLEVLRDRIRELEGAPVHTQRVSTGIGVFDDLVGGLPQPGLVEIHGPPGSGRTRLALALIERFTAEGRLVAWVDLDCTLYPPAAGDLEVVLRRLLVVRPTQATPAERRPLKSDTERAVWATEQLLRCGCFPLVVVSGAVRLGRVGQRWVHAAEAGGGTCLVIGEHASRGIPAVVRLAVGRGEVVVVRNRGGRTGRAAVLPPWTERNDPWR
ncbi:MAG: hypothetical protein JRJ84_12625 [Deltaproteobacteria bacterium]|nr:hypothetical protein [Deltaproteobacteria bacterium]